MNVGEYGNVLRIDANEDISTNTNIVTLTSPAPVVKDLILNAGNGLSVGTSTVTINGVVFTANEYIEYTFKDGDIFIAGEWGARLYSQTLAGTICKITNDDLSFVVGA